MKTGLVITSNQNTLVNQDSWSILVETMKVTLNAYGSGPNYNSYTVLVRSYSATLIFPF